MTQDPKLVGVDVIGRFVQHGLGPTGKPSTFVFRCVGDCGAVVQKRNEWCSDCAAAAAKHAVDRPLNAAHAGISPEGTRDWCVPGNPAYVQATQKAVRLATGLEPRKLGLAWKRMFETAEWTPAIGNILLLGPTAIGKSKILAAIGLRLIAKARESRRPDAIRFASGIVWASGLELARARSTWSLGEDDPPLIRRAKRANLLIIDEIGFEDGRLDPHALRDVLRYRYDEHQRPTIAGSGATKAALHERYGEATVRLLWDIGDRGHIIDLHPKEAEARR